MKKALKVTRQTVPNLALMISVGMSLAGCFSKDDATKRIPADAAATPQPTVRPSESPQPVKSSLPEIDIFKINTAFTEVQLKQAFPAANCVDANFQPECDFAVKYDNTVQGDQACQTTLNKLQAMGVFAVGRQCSFFPDVFTKNPVEALFLDNKIQMIRRNYEGIKQPLSAISDAIFTLNHLTPNWDTYKHKPDNGEYQKYCINKMTSEDDGLLVAVSTWRNDTIKGKAEPLVSLVTYRRAGLTAKLETDYFEKIKAQEVNESKTLLGYDVSKSMKAFRFKYADKIKKCDTMVVKFTGGTSTAETISCEMINGTVEFYGNEVYKLSVTIPASDVKLGIAADKLAEKAGHKSEMKRYQMDSRFGYMPVCLAEVPFNRGKAKILSVEAMSNELLASATEGDSSTCSDLFAKSIQYENSESESAMKREISTKQEAKDKKAGASFSL